VFVPTKREKTKTIKQYDREQRKKSKATTERNLPSNAYNETNASPAAIRFMPHADTEFDVTGPHPDPRLVDHARNVLDTFMEDTATGRLFVKRPTYVTQAMLVLYSASEIWDYQDFLKLRDQWRPCREISGMTGEDLGNRVNLSFASISRYEKGDRKPDSAYLRPLHLAYTEALDTGLWKIETDLVRDSFFEHYAHENNLPLDETLEYDLIKGWDDYAWWLSGSNGADFDNLTIDHIPHLASIRRFLPRPAWREPAFENLWLKGFRESEPRTSSPNAGADMAT
jgi:transcriptional regulator with XRE-family HTH domain